MCFFMLFFIMIKGIEIEVRKQLGTHMVYGFFQAAQKFIEVFFVKKNFMAIIAVIIKPFTAFGDGQEIITAFGSANIKKVCPSLSGFNPFAVNTIHFLVRILVSHVQEVLVLNLDFNIAEQI